MCQKRKSKQTSQHEGNANEEPKTQKIWKEIIEQNQNHGKIHKKTGYAWQMKGRKEMHTHKHKTAKQPGCMRGESMSKRNGIKPVKMGLMEEKSLEESNQIGI